MILLLVRIAVHTYQDADLSVSCNPTLGTNYTTPNKVRNKVSRSH